MYGTSYGPNMNALPNFGIQSDPVAKLRLHSLISSPVVIAQSAHLRNTQGMVIILGSIMLNEESSMLLMIHCRR